MTEFEILDDYSNFMVLINIIDPTKSLDLDFD